LDQKWRSHKFSPRQEAKQILNVKDINDAEALQTNYDHLFKVNDKKSGGSFYLQSKVLGPSEKLITDTHTP